MRWSGALQSQENLTVEYGAHEVDAFHAAFTDWYFKYRPTSIEELELELKWATVHRDASMGLTGTLDELVATAGMLGVYGHDTKDELNTMRANAELIGAQFTKHARREMRSRKYLGGVASSMAKGMGARLGADVVIDVDKIEMEFYADFFRQPAV
jgi:hypothetical protein